MPAWTLYIQYAYDGQRQRLTGMCHNSQLLKEGETGSVSDQWLASRKLEDKDVSLALPALLSGVEWSVV